MEISGLLKAVSLDLKAQGHGPALNELSARILPKGPQGEAAICDLKGHESAEGVLSGTGSAIFHCLSESVSDTVMGIAVTRRPISGRGKRPVRIFFLIVSPIKESGTHIQVLSKLEGMLQDGAFRHALENARTEGDVKRAFKRVEGASRTLYIPLPKEEVFAELTTGPHGLTDGEAAKRLGLTGPNSIKRIEKSPLLKDLLKNLFFNFFAVLLWAGGAMSFIAGMPQLGWAIFLVIMINAVFSFWQEYKAERAVEALGRLLPKKVRAVRGGNEKEVDAGSLVPGDLIRLSEGDSIPADGRLIEAEAMRVDNSPLTGESRPVYKTSEPLIEGTGFVWTEVPNMVFAGTAVLSGSGEMVVTATGMDTEIGRVAYLTQAIRAELSPLQKEITNITKTVTLIAVSLGALFFLLGYTIAGLSFAESFIFAIGIIVANVPEGLLPTVSLSLAMGVQRMAGKRAIVKKLSAVETLGSATVICTDKTGTLTANRMCVKKIFTNDKVIEVTGEDYSPEGSFIHDEKSLSKEDLATENVTELLRAAALCNNASLHPPQKDGQWTVSGDPTEAALLTAAAKAGIDLEELNSSNKRIAHIPFERVRKRMSTVHERADGRAAAYVKGAPGEMLEICDRVLMDGKARPFTAEEKEQTKRKNDAMASTGLRVLAIAFKDVEKKEAYSAEEAESSLVFIGLAAMLDPPRPEVKKAVADCHSAGIKVVMVTGDYGLTAKAVADEIGLSPKTRVVSGEELKRLGGSGLEELLRKEEVIFSRVTPGDKLRVVEALQRNGEVVAVTGDGVNDAPALKKADIGIAMGMRGNDVAKESAEIVLADDNFATIVDAVREGRAVYANIKKFVTYIFASNIPEVIPFIAFVLFKIPLPLTVMQILAVDLGTDVLPALGLGIEPPEKGIMSQPPRPRGKRLLDFRTLSRAYLFLGPLEAALAMGAFFYAYWLRGWMPGEVLSPSGAAYAAATTMTFAGIVACQIGNVFACRTEKQSVFSVGLFTNRFVIVSIFAEIAIMLTLIYVPGVSSLFGFHALMAADWALLLLFPAIMLGAEEARKRMARIGAK